MAALDGPAGRFASLLREPDWPGRAATTDPGTVRTAKRAIRGQATGWCSAADRYAAARPRPRSRHPVYARGVRLACESIADESLAPHTRTNVPVPLRSESSLAQYETTTIARPRDRSARRMAYAARLWLIDAALFRLDHYHWESRRRRLKKYDLRRRAKRSGSRR